MKLLQKLLLVAVLIITLLGLKSFGQSNILRTDLIKGSAIYVDTLSINNPILIKKDGIGYLSSLENFNPAKPNDIFEEPFTCLVMGDFTENGFNGFYDEMLLFTCDPKVFSYLKDNGLYRPIYPKFKYSKSYKGCHVYECDDDKFCILLFLARIEKVNIWLNPLYDLASKNKKPKERKLKSAHPYMEFIKVAVPINNSK